jgi:hypothetical protein
MVFFVKISMTRLCPNFFDISLKIHLDHNFRYGTLLSVQYCSIFSFNGYRTAKGMVLYQETTICFNCLLRVYFYFFVSVANPDFIESGSRSRPSANPNPDPDIGF